MCPPTPIHDNKLLTSTLWLLEPGACEAWLPPAPRGRAGKRLGGLRT